MTALPDGTRVSVPLSVNGKPVSLVVDTGAGASSLTGPTAATLGLRPRSSETAHLLDKDGAPVHRYYLADSFQLGPLVGKRIPFLQQADIGDAEIDGTMGPDLMARYDVEMDFAEQRLTYFSQAHCPGHIVHWSADAVTQGIASAADVDAAMRYGTNYPQGPLAWADQLGAAYVARVLGHLHEHYGEERYRLSPLIRRRARSHGRLHA